MREHTGLEVSTLLKVQITRCREVLVRRVDSSICRMQLEAVRSITQIERSYDCLRPGNKWTSQHFHKFGPRAMSTISFDKCCRNRWSLLEKRGNVSSIYI